MDYRMSLMSQFYNHPQKVNLYVFTANGSYTPVVDAWHWFTVVGAGGSGAFANGIGQWNIATGGNGGNVRVGWVFLRAAQTYTITVGAGGVSITGIAGVNGNDGGTSSISGGDLSASIVAGGGKGGKFSETSYTVAYNVTPLTVENDANTAGSGAGVEYSGGKGGKVTLNGSALIVTDTFTAATGGGAANLFGVGAASCRGGDITHTGFAGTSTGLSSGGGGCGGSGGDFSGSQSQTSGGGGTAGNGGSRAGGLGTGLTDYLTPGGEGGDTFDGILSTQDDNLVDAGIGGGGGGFPIGSLTYWIERPAGHGTRWGGGGGSGFPVTSNEDLNCAGNGGPNGGGGGGNAITPASKNGKSGAGGAGAVILQAYISPAG
jgi:hypothetical protein